MTIGFVHGNAQLLQHLERVFLSVDSTSFYIADHVAEESERSGGGDLRVELPDRARGGIPRIREQGQAFVGPLLIELAEDWHRQVDLASYLDRPDVIGIGQAKRDRFDRSEISSDVFADNAVASCSSANETAAFVCESNRNSVDLQLGHIADPIDFQ